MNKAYAECRLTPERRMIAFMMQRNTATAAEQARAAAEAELAAFNDLPAALLRRAFNGEV